MKLPEVHTYRYRRPLEERSFLIETPMHTEDEIRHVIDTYRLGPLRKFSLHNINHPWVSLEQENANSAQRLSAAIT